MQNIQKWAITRIDDETVIKYYNSEISNYEIFKNSPYDIYVATWNYGYESEIYKIVSSAEISDEDLPPKDSYLYIDTSMLDYFACRPDNSSC